MKQKGSRFNDSKSRSMLIPKNFQIPAYEIIRSMIIKFNEEVIGDLSETDDGLIVELNAFKYNIVYNESDLTDTLAKIHVDRLYKIVPYLAAACDKKPHQLEAYANLLYCCAELLIEVPKESLVNNSHIQDQENCLLQAALSLKTVYDALIPHKEHISLNLEPYEMMALKCLNQAEEQYEATPSTAQLSTTDERFLAAYKRYAGYQWSNPFIRGSFQRRVLELMQKMEHEHLPVEQLQETLSCRLYNFFFAQPDYQSVTIKNAHCNEHFIITSLPTKQSHLSPSSSLRHRKPEMQIENVPSS